MPDYNPSFACHLASYPVNKILVIKFPQLITKYLNTSTPYELTPWPAVDTPEEPYRRWIILPSDRTNASHLRKDKGGRYYTLTRSSISLQPSIGYFGITPATATLNSDGNVTITMNGQPAQLGARQPPGFRRQSPKAPGETKFKLIEPIANEYESAKKAEPAITSESTNTGAQATLTASTKDDGLPVANAPGKSEQASSSESAITGGLDQQMQDLLIQINNIESTTSYRLEFDPIVRQWVFVHRIAR